ncbi:MAG: ADP-ribosylglycohydrolase family protein [Candidatus Adiutrix sp.]|jgi:ADP-ribosylglycohydrolase|nr:ADP-ribosylglycohydrolase family protein [Candidatus Adiutrix sp.]
MLGAVIGDICGSIYEHHNKKTDNLDEIRLLDPRGHFTDDTVLTIAVAEACLSGREYLPAIQKWALRYPHAGYGSAFRRWLATSDDQPYNSYGNGSAMRVSPLGWFCRTLEETLVEARRSAEVTHNHPEGGKGTQAVGAAIFLAQNGASKSEIKSYIQESFQYDLERTVEQIRPDYHFDSSCQGTVPEKNSKNSSLSPSSDITNQKQPPKSGKEQLNNNMRYFLGSIL